MNSRLVEQSKLPTSVSNYCRRRQLTSFARFYIHHVQKVSNFIDFRLIDCSFSSQRKFRSIESVVAFDRMTFRFRLCCLVDLWCRMLRYRLADAILIDTDRYLCDAEYDSLRLILAS